MVSRVSDKQRYDIAARRLNNVRVENDKQLEQLATQKRIMKLSDDPAGVMKAVNLRDQLNQMDQFQKNLDFSKGYIEKTETAIQTLNDNLIRARELAVAMANDTNDEKSRQATSLEIKQIMQDCISLGNTQFNGRFIFGGFRNQTPPLSLDGDFSGDDGVIYLQTSKDRFQQVSVSARGLFEASPEEQEKGHTGMIAALRSLYEGMSTNNKVDIQSALAELDFHLDKSTSYQATMGSLWTALNNSEERIEKQKVNDADALSKVEDADFFKVTSDFKKTETLLQSTLLASNKLLQPTLLNFLQ